MKRILDRRLRQFLPNNRKGNFSTKLCDLAAIAQYGTFDVSIT